jgi:hypothetical protein
MRGDYRLLSGLGTLLRTGISWESWPSRATTNHMKYSLAALAFTFGLAGLAGFAVIGCSGTTATTPADGGTEGGTGVGSCVEGGKTYASGTAVPSRDNCNTCFCSSGNISCTERACADGGSECVYDGKTYALGTTFKSTDGCNDCSCSAAGVACTKKACLTDAGTDADAGDGGYTCPKDGTYNCQPAVPPENQFVCSQPYRAWVQANCPGVTYVD